MGPEIAWIGSAESTWGPSMLDEAVQRAHVAWLCLMRQCWEHMRPGMLGDAVLRAHGA